MPQHTKVIAGPAGHWYALSEHDNELLLVGKPMAADEDPAAPPVHPHVSDPDWKEWYEIVDPAPETDVKELIAKLAPEWMAHSVTIVFRVRSKSTAEARQKMRAVCRNLPGWPEGSWEIVRIVPGWSRDGR